MDAPPPTAAPLLAEPVIPTSHPTSDPAVVPAADAAPPVAVPASRPAPEQLSERDGQLLDFERRWWRHAGSKEQAIRDEFGLSPTRYYQLLNRLIDDPVALAYDPVLVKRLRRLRASRSRARRAPATHQR